MRIHLVTPAPAGSRAGNRVTAERWARILRDLGHRVSIARGYTGELCDVLIALHARKSFDAIRRFRRLRPGTPLIVALAGTDLYRDLGRSRSALRALEWATRIVVLQPEAIKGLPAGLRSRASVILQSALPASRRMRPGRSEFRVCVLGHLRALKDPFRVAMACRLLPASSRIRVIHLGRALSARMAERARAEMARNPRYRWLGEVPHERALRILDGSRLLVLPSRVEGGANVASEALVAGVPILASRIPGSVGILGADYPGTFPLADTPALARLLTRCESESGFLLRLRLWCARLAPRFRPSRERAAWAALLREIAPAGRA